MISSYGLTPPGVIVGSYCPRILVGVYGAAIGDIPKLANGLPDGGTYGAIVNGAAVEALLLPTAPDTRLATVSASFIFDNDGNSNGIFDPGGPTSGGGGVPGVLGGPLGMGGSKLVPGGPTSGGGGVPGVLGGPDGIGASIGGGSSRLGGGGVPGVLGGPAGIGGSLSKPVSKLGGGGVPGVLGGPLGNGGVISGV